MPKTSRGMKAIELSLFFFSSRRRHTRFDCDWSSDVCSSDLVEPPGAPRVDADAYQHGRPARQRGAPPAALQHAGGGRLVRAAANADARLRAAQIGRASCRERV